MVQKASLNLWENPSGFSDFRACDTREKHAEGILCGFLNSRGVAPVWTDAAGSGPVEPRQQLGSKLLVKARNALDGKVNDAHAHRQVQTGGMGKRLIHAPVLAVSPS